MHVHEIARRLAARGIETTQFSCSFRGAPRAERLEGLDVLRLGRIPLYYPRVAARVARDTRAGRFDLVVEHLNKLPFYAALYSAVPVVAICHHLLAETAFLQAPWPIAASVWLAERLIPYAYRRVPIAAVSASTQGDLVARGLPPEGIRIIHNGISLPEVPEVSAGGRPPRLVYLGRLEPYKRVEILLRVVRSLAESVPGLEAWVIGRGTAEARLRRLSRELGVDARVHFTGFVSDAERDAILARSRVCLCPSLREGWGLTVIEANAAGVPVVASDAPGLRDAVRHGQTGFLVGGESDADFARRTEDLLRDDVLADRMSRAAVEWAHRFSWDSAADETEAFLWEAVGRGQPVPARAGKAAR